MKTVLPTKVDDSLELEEDCDFRARATINQLIDVVAELREVVEGKQNPNSCSPMTASTPGSYTPPLKEQLLGEMAVKSYRKSIESELVVDLTDVEAIIQRLMP